ncbi:MAG TPA: hypothetical protein DC042_02390 [Bacteroidales bacterium]|nr:hypothetical protein [Bacteroidales bacterium]
MLSSQPAEEISMKSLVHALRFSLLALLFLLAAIILDPIAHRKTPVRLNSAGIERDFHKKLARLDLTGAVVLETVKRDGWPGAATNDPGFYKRYTDENDGIALFILRGDSVLFWSDNSLVVSDADLSGIQTDRIYNLPNCNVFCRVFEQDSLKVVGMTFLKKFFPYNNEYVSTAFLIGKNIPPSYRISEPPVPGAISIHDDHGEYCFCIVPGYEMVSRSNLHWITLLFYGLFFIFLLLGFSDLMNVGQRLKPSGLWLLALAADLFLLRWLFGALEFPHCVFSLPLFRPFENPRFLLESRGGFLVTAVLLIFFSYWFMRVFRLFPASLSADRSKTDSRLVQSLGVAGWLMVAGFFLLIHWLAGYLLIQRPGFLEITRILSFSASSVTDMIILVGLLMAYLMVVHGVVSQMKHRLTWPQAVIGLLLATALVFGLARSGNAGPDLGDLGFFYVTAVLSVYLNYTPVKRLSHGIAVILIFLISTYLVAITDEANRSKEAVSQPDILDRLSNEHDPIAEMLLAQADPEIQKDTLLGKMVINPALSPSESQSVITSYLKKRYFGLYWNRYEIQARTCDSVSRILIQPDNFEVPCLPYFLGEMRDRFGTRLTGTAGFYYLDNFDGLIDYLGVYRYFNADSTYGANLIINIDSRLVAQEMGYPELLVTGRINHDSLFTNYSYAKYQHGKLQSVSGNFGYSLTSDGYPGKTGEILTFVRDGYRHWIKRIDSENQMVISRPVLRLLDYVVTFSYVFVFLFIIYFLVYVVLQYRTLISVRSLGLKQRIQLTLISILVFSFLLIGGGMTYFVIQQYRESTTKLIVEKTESLLTDLQHKIEKEQVLTRDWNDETYRGLDELLLKFSYVFNTDMNIFDPQGNLIVSTRPEVFDYYLAGKKMNPIAYDALHNQQRTSFIIRESIESLGYYSSYVPLLNQDGILLGYLNLPYFSRQTEIRREIANLVVAMLNGYFILIMLSIFFAVVLANQVSKPLEQLQTKLAGLRFGRKNLEIDYRRDDEIGKLVRDYNRMVNELQAGAEKLARSERETAWREMARQIAHEIKNPLTPMKLSVQHLRRAWKDQAPNLDMHIDKVTNTLIDQIDTLSSIASEFSRFAQMPGAHFEPIDLVSKLRQVTYLFEDSCKVTLHEVEPSGQEVVLYADPEQLLQVFNNLMRNAIQAVPETKEPTVDIFIDVRDHRVIVRIADNGSGIPDELHDRLFEPNFTTKSSGMGLGLAITKKIVEGTEGNIWFETVKNEGTTFYIEWPLYQPEK